MSSTLMHRVFVYGTLKTSQPNNYVLQTCHGVAQFIGKGITKSLYPLVVACRYNIPFLLPFEGKGKNINGEVYSVDDKMLNILDDFEGHPTFYKRQQISVLLGDKCELCWCYILQKCRPELLQLPFIDNYDNNTQQLKYVIRYKRDENFRSDVQLE